VYAIDTDGRSLGTYQLAGVGAVDWEDVVAVPGPTRGTSFLDLGDIGDNSRSRASIQVHRVPEPRVDPRAPAGAIVSLEGVETFDLRYPDAPRRGDAARDPVSGDLFVVTKDLVGGVGRVFRAPAGTTPGTTTVLQEVATVSLGPGRGVTGGDVTSGCDVVALRTYFGVTLFRRRAGGLLATAFSGSPCAGAAPAFGTSTTSAEAQGEAIGFTRDGRGYLTLSEGAHVPLHRFRARWRRRPGAPHSEIGNGAILGQRVSAPRRRSASGASSGERHRPGWRLPRCSHRPRSPARPRSTRRRCRGRVAAEASRW
jgi:hypothetical protein